MRPHVTMRAALNDPDLFGSILAGDSWRAWRILLIAIMGEPLIDEERSVFESLTGRPAEPTEQVEEFWAAIGRRGGKSRAIATLGGYVAGNYPPPFFGRADQGDAADFRAPPCQGVQSLNPCVRGSH